MRRTQIQLDETTYQLAKRKAFTEGVSLAAVVREALKQYLAPEDSAPLTIEDLGFVGIGSSDQGNLSRISERHDEDLAEVFAY